MVSRDPGMNFRTVSKMVWAKQNHIFMAHLFWLASFFLAEVHLAAHVGMNGNHFVQFMQIGLG